MGGNVRADEDGELFHVERSADIIKHKGYCFTAFEYLQYFGISPVVGNVIFL
jgi:acyl-coenzyme A synthetase/AMP-(fatty) acid ligase